MNDYPSFTLTWHRTSYSSISPTTNPTLSFASKNILITGGGTGGGLAMARSFALAGAAHIGLLGRRIPVLSTAAAALSTEFPGTQFHTYSADVANELAVDTAFAAFEKDAGKIDVGIHNAGFQPALAPLSEMSPDDFKAGIDTNVMGSLYFIRAFLRAAAAEAVLIYVSSAVMHLPTMANWAGYAVSKEAATKLFMHVVAENKNVRVHAIHPGLLETDMSAMNIPKGSGVVFDDMSLAGDFAVWISSPEAKFLNGTFVWSNWDVEEMKERAEEIEKGYLLRMGLVGWDKI
ncbi:NAD(P)-binding protein [Lophium mytilinum]|uniref:NAD(P)-binding protein n=1 Tax=Lophium mytilinum TaxID=390894 RepID=A0A6A6QSW4_9PEZI|nr:NAD(P)-binding protein [Lophium mytilinum]